MVTKRTNKTAIRKKAPTSLFGEVAIGEYLVSREVFEAALKEQEKIRKGGSNIYVGQILVNNGDLSPQQVSTILDIQKQLLMGGISNPALIASEKGAEALRSAHKKVAFQRALPWALGGLVLFLLVAVFYLIGRSQRETLTALAPVTAIEPRPTAASVPDPVQPVGVPSSEALLSQASMPTLVESPPDTVVTTPEIEEVPDPPSGPSLADLVLQVIDRKTPFMQRKKTLKALDDFPTQEVFNHMERVWLEADARDSRLLILVVNYLYGRDPDQAVTVLRSLTDTFEQQALGYASLLAIIGRVRQEPFVTELVLDGISSTDPFIQEKAILGASRLDSVFDANLVEALWEVGSNGKDSKLAVSAIRTLYSQGSYTQYLRLLTLMEDASDKLKHEVVGILFKNQVKEAYSGLEERISRDPSLEGILIQHLRIYTSSWGEALLLAMLKDATDTTKKLKIIRTLSSYDSNRVLSALRDLFDHELPVIDETIRALRKITRKNFGYHFGGGLADNSDKLGLWKQYIETRIQNENLPPSL